MLRKLALALTVCIGCSLVALAQPGKLDKSKLFEKMDADGNGKVSKEEYAKFRDSMVERIKEKLGDKAARLGEVLEKAFDKMDANADGSISKEEFEKFEGPGLLGGLGGGKLDPEKLKELLKKKKGGE
jgi:Ca2+-binding EF-hand superfamily protein